MGNTDLHVRGDGNVLGAGKLFHLLPNIFAGGFDKFILQFLRER